MWREDPSESMSKYPLRAAIEFEDRKGGVGITVPCNGGVDSVAGKFTSIILNLFDAPSPVLSSCSCLRALLSTFSDLPSLDGSRNLLATAAQHWVLCWLDSVLPF
jgi:hypothetical protein